MLLSRGYLVALPPTGLGVRASLPLRYHRDGPFLARRRCLDLRGVPAAEPSAVARNGSFAVNSLPQSSGVYTVGDFMTKGEHLHVVKPDTSVDEALEMLVENRITGFPVIDDDWNLVHILAIIGESYPVFLKLKKTLSEGCSHITVGVVSDYDLLALDSISGSGRADTSMFPEVDSTWKAFDEIQKLLSKTNGRTIGEVMTSAPLVVRETTNLEDAARLLLETKYRRLPVVDSDDKLVGIITRANVVSAALQIKHEIEKSSQV